MSKTIDEKVVSMQFDNKNFERNVSTTMSTLDKFKQKLNFKGAASSLDTVGASFTEVENLACSSGFKIKDVWLKVSQVLEYQVAGKIIQIGKNITKAFTIDPVKSGLQEYETQLNSVQTILANTESKGSTLQDVNNALNELNLYADKTIYNFTQMTRNIGTFTAAGVDLKTSVSAIKGIANLAAVSGSTSQQASAAMYQLSQALSSGTVKLMDWNSVVNAGMGGQVFQDALKETARVHGIAIDNMIAKEGSFRETLSNGWLSSEILLETLNKFTGDLSEQQLKSMGYTEDQIKEIIKLGETANNAATKVKTFTQLLDTLKEAAQSGWTQTWQLIIGDFEEAKNLWTKVSDTIGGLINNMSEARNKLLTGALSTGWKQLMGEGIMDENGYIEFIKRISSANNIKLDGLNENGKEVSDFEEINELIKNGTITSDMLKESLNNFSGEVSNLSAEQLQNLGYTNAQVEALMKLNGEFQNGSRSMDDFYGKMQRMSGRELLFQGIANIFNNIKNIFSEIRKAFKEIFNPDTNRQSEALYNGIKGFEEFTRKIMLSEEQLDKLKRTFKGLFALVDIIMTVIKSVASAIFNVGGKVLGVAGDVGDGFLTVTASIGDFLCKVRDGIKGSETFMYIIEGLGKVASKVGEIFRKAFNKIKETFQSSKFLDGLKKFMSVVGKVISTVWDQLSKFFSWLGTHLVTFWNKEKEAFNKLINDFGSIWGAIKAVFAKIKNTIVEFFNTNFESGNGGGILALLTNGGILATAAIIIKKIMDKFNEVGGLIRTFKEAIETITAPLKTFQQSLKADIIKKLAISIGVLAGSILLISFIKEDNLKRAISSLVISLAMLLTGLKIISKLGGSASSLTINKKGLKKVDKSINDALIPLVTSILILVSTLAILSKMDEEGIKRGLVSLGAIMLLLAGTMVIMQKSTNKMKASDARTKAIKQSIKAITRIAHAVLVLSFALKSMASMEWKEIGRGLAVMGGSLAILVGALAILNLFTDKKFKHTTKTIDESKTKKLSKSVSSLRNLILSLLLLAGALKLFATMSWEDFGKSMAVMASSLVILIGALAVLNLLNEKIREHETKTITETKANLLSKNVKALRNIIVSLLLLSGVLKIFATMSWEDFGKSMAIMGSSLVILVGALAVLSKIDGTKLGKKIWSLTLVVTSLLILAGAIKLLSLITWDQFALSFVYMISTLSALLAALSVINKFGSANIAKSSASLIIMSIALTALIVPLAILGHMKIETIAKGLIAICAAILTFVGIAAIFGHFAPMLMLISTSILEIAGAIALFSASTILLGVGLTLIGTGLITIVTAITILLGALTGVAGGITVIIGAIVAGIVLLVAEIIKLIPLLCEKLAEGLVAIILVLGKNAPALGKALVDIVLSMLYILEESIPKLANSLFGIITGLLDSLITFVPKIVDQLITFIFAVLDSLSNWIPDIIVKLVEFFASVFDGVVSSLQSIDPEVLLKSIGALGALTALFAALSALAGMVPMAMVGVLGLGVLISELALVLAAVGELTLIPGLQEAIANGGELLQTIGEALGKFVGGIVGGFGEALSNSLPSIATNLSTFMTNLTPFIQGVKMVTWDTVDSVGALAASLLAITSTSIFEALAGWTTNSLSSVATNLSEFMTNLMPFLMYVKMVDESVLNSTKYLAQMLLTITAANIIENLTSWLTGKSSMSDFAEQIVLFGQGMKGFSEVVTGIDTNAVSTAAQAGVILGQMAQSLPKNGGLVGFFSGKKDAGEFGTQLKAFGSGMKDFYNSVTGINFEEVIRAANTGERLGTILSNMSFSGGFWSIKDVKKSIDDKLTKFASAIKKFISTMSGIGDVYDTSAKLSALNNALKDFGASGVDGFINEFKNAKTNLKEAINSMIDSAIFTLSDKASIFINAGKSYFTGLIATVTIMHSEVKSAFTTPVKDSIIEIRNLRDDFYEAGVYAAEGLKNGITSNSSSIVEKVKNIASSMVSAVKNALLIKSPSRKFYEIGEFSVLGLENAIYDGGSDVSAATESLANSSLKGMKNAVSKIANAIDGEMDLNPTIRPVLDLSDITSGANRINSMLDMNPSVGLLSRVNSISTMMNKNQNGSNEDVASAINRLSKSIDDKPSNTYNINAYSDNAELSNAIETIIRYAQLERRI